MGAVRSAYVYEDSQQCFYKLLVAKCSGVAPWTSWEVQLSNLEEEQQRQTDKPIIYVLTPKLILPLNRQQGGRSLGGYEIIIGAHDDRGVGGEEEINIITSHLEDFFTDPQTCHTQQFTVDTDTTNTNTTLIAMGIRVEEIVGFREIAVEDLKEFRKESIVRFIT